MPNTGWQPASREQALALSCPAWELLFEGRRFTGKTDALLMDFAQHVGQGYGPAWRGVLFRRTFPDLRDVIARSEVWFKKIFPAARYNRTDHEWRWPDGESLIFRFIRHAQDYRSYHGHEYPWMGWEELTSWPLPECYELMASCSRSSRPGMPRKIRATTNPWGPGHKWVKRRFVDALAPMEMREFGGLLRARITGKPVAKLAESDPEYEKRLASISNENLRRAWQEGDWDVVVGGAFEDVWWRERNVVRPFKIPPGWRVDRGFDWGSSAPFSVIWWAEADGEDWPERDFPNVPKVPAGSLVAVAEWHGDDGNGKGLRLTSAEIADGIKEREAAWSSKRGIFECVREIEAGPADNSIFDVVNGTSIYDDFEARGVFWDRSNKGPGSRIAGLNAVRTMLKAAHDGRKDPCLLVSSHCRKWQDHVPVLQLDPDNPEDIEDGQQDHDYDVTRYRVLKQNSILNERQVENL